MKYIQKSTPPAELVAYRQRPGATYAKMRRVKRVYNAVKTSLAKEQGYICCYCGRRINGKDDTQIEHFFAKGTPAYVKLQLDYETNLLACCDGGKTDSTTGTSMDQGQYCEAVKKSNILPVNPLTIECEEKFLFAEDGEVIGVGKDAEVTIDILNLNSPVIKNLRKYAIDNYSLFPPKSWDSELQRLKRRNTSDQFEEFCFVLESYIQTFHT